MREKILLCVMFCLLCTSVYAGDARTQVFEFARTLAEDARMPPGYAVVIVDDEGTYIDTGGVADVGSERPVTRDTVFYVASITKSYFGLLAAKLDSDNRFPLDMTLADVWPGLRLPSGIDADKVTFRALLSHTTPFDNDVIGWQGSFSKALTPGEVADALQKWSEPQSGFEYTNNGYIVTAAAMEKRLGVSWKTLLDREVLTPLGLRDTAAQTSVFARERMAFPHALTASGWTATSVKTDDVCHAAGGIHASVRDVAAWMEVMLGKRGGLDKKIVQAALVRQADQAREYHGFNRSGYALGWNVSEYRGRVVYEHGGGWYGTRAFASFMPDAGIGVAVLSNGGMTGNLFNINLLQFAYDMLLGDADSRLTAQRVANVEDALAEIEPVSIPTVLRDTDLTVYAGTYFNEALREMELRVIDDRLHAQIGAYSMVLVPTASGFSASEYPESDPDDIRFVDHVNGEPQALDWEGIVFQRVSPSP